MESTPTWVPVAGVLLVVVIIVRSTLRFCRWRERRQERSSVRVGGVRARSTFTFVVASVIAAALIADRTTWPTFAAWLGAINLVAIGWFWYDKRAASFGLGRVPESSFHTMALLGGWGGISLGRSMFKHKTVKQPFNRRLSLATIANMAVLVVYVQTRTGT